ncbi:MAG: hypothetical protein LC624_10100, partial [Halobacteriales archaeon]|nr:hypothetical protein [Halobacteriales archaeon]
LSPATGWTWGGGKLEWTGSRSLANDDALEWRFSLQGGAPVRDATVPDQLTWDQRNGDVRSASWQAQPGAWRAVVGPATGGLQGFDTAAGDHSTNLNASYQGEPLRGSQGYTVSTASVVAASASDIARGAAESWLTRDNATVAPGGRVTFTWNASRVVDELGVQVASFKCYTSTAGAWQLVGSENGCTSGPGLAWQFRHEAPAVSLRVYHPIPANGTAPALEGQMTGLAASGSASYDVPTGGLLGTHVVELRAEFRLHDTGSGQATQMVHLLTTYDVAPDGVTRDASPGYVVLVRAWMPEWS